jgi:hypothetical protein
MSFVVRSYKKMNRNRKETAGIKCNCKTIIGVKAGFTACGKKPSQKNLETIRFL